MGLGKKHDSYNQLRRPVLRQAPCTIPAIMLCVHLTSSLLMPQDLWGTPVINATKKGAQRAKDMVASVMASQVGATQRQVYLEEVLAYAVYFLGSDGEPSVARIKNYLMFSGDKLLPQESEGSDRAALCVGIRTEPGCKECEAVTAELNKKIPSLIKRRKLEYRSIPAPARGPDPSSYDADYTHPDAFEKFSLEATEGGCVNIFYVGLGAADRGSVKAAFFLDVKDRSKKRLRSEYQATEPVVNRNAQLEYTPGEALLARGVSQVFSGVGADLEQQQLSLNSGPERFLILEGIKSFQDYVTFKRKLLEGVNGLAALEERVMATGRVEFLVTGSVTLAQIQAKLLQIIGPEPVISEYKLESDLRMRVVLK